MKSFRKKKTKISLITSQKNTISTGMFQVTNALGIAGLQDIAHISNFGIMKWSAMIKKRSWDEIVTIST